MSKTCNLHHYEGNVYPDKIYEDQFSAHNQTKLYGALKITVFIENALDSPLCTVGPIFVKMLENDKKGLYTLSNNHKHPYFFVF